MKNSTEDLSKITPLHLKYKSVYGCILAILIDEVYMDVGTGGPKGPWPPTFWQTMQKCPFQIEKCPFQIHNIIIFNVILIAFTLDGNFGILFFHSTFEIFYMN